MARVVSLFFFFFWWEVLRWWLMKYCCLLLVGQSHGITGIKSKTFQNDKGYISFSEGKLANIQTKWSKEICCMCHLQAIDKSYKGTAESWFREKFGEDAVVSGIPDSIVLQIQMPNRRGTIMAKVALQLTESAVVICHERKLKNLLLSSSCFSMSCVT